MNPLIAIATAVLPDILKAVVGDKSEKVVDAVAKAVKDATGTDVPAEAEKKVAADPAVEKELRIKLAEIAADEEEKKRQAELEQQKLQMQEADQQHKADMDALRTRFEEDAKKRDDDFRRLQAGLADTQSARTAFGDLAKAGNPFAWGPVAVSLVVTIGFFTILVVLMTLWGKPADTRDPTVTQIINIAIGALTAGFATVISFWLGSSQGSRNKDFAAVELQTQAQTQTAKLVEQHNKQTEQLLDKTVGATPEGQPEKAKPSNFRRCVDIILEKEGGYVDDPHDPGGATNMGITFATLKDWRGADITKQDVKDLPVDEARNIYEAKYWKVMNCDSLPAGVDLVVFDFGVNAGPGRSAKLLQRVCGANADGVVGPITAGAVKSLDAAQVVRRFGELRLEYYQSLSGWARFGKGWARRTDEVGRAALAMVG